MTIFFYKENVYGLYRPIFTKTYNECGNSNYVRYNVNGLVGLMGCRTNGLSDQWAVELMGCRTTGKLPPMRSL